MFTPSIRLPNIPGALNDPSEWEAALLDTQEGFYGPWGDPFFGRTRIIPVTTQRSDPPPPVRTPIPVANQGWEYVYPEPPTVIREVLPRPVAVRDAPVPRAVVVVAGLPTEVERHEEGDYPAGSIFAPGEPWGGSDDLDARLPEQEDDVSIWSDIGEWAIDTITGQQPWQGVQQFQQAFNPMGPAFVASSPIPSGSPALPPSAAPYVGAKMTNGQDCGNRRYVTLDRETGKISCKRRRRRRLLTNRDLADLASLKTITGGGAALNAAVIRAVR